jgi:hypothetical protein
VLPHIFARELATLRNGNMPGRPHLECLSQQITDAGGDEVIFEQIAAATPIRKIVEPFTNPETGQPYSRPMIYQWIHAGGPEREKRWEEAKKIAAHIHVEEAGHLLETNNPISSAAASHLKARADHKKWLAKSFNRK